MLLLSRNQTFGLWPVACSSGLLQKFHYCFSNPPNNRTALRRYLNPARFASLLVFCVFVFGSSAIAAMDKNETAVQPPAITSKDKPPICERVITAKVVALEQVYTYNRFGAFNPAGLMYALRRDVVANDNVNIKGKNGTAHIGENDQIPQTPELAADRALSGKVRLRSDKRPRPLVLRVNEGDCLEVTFTNLLSPATNGQEIYNEPLARLRPDEGEVGLEAAKQRQVLPLDSEEPRTRHASMHVNGLDYVGGHCPEGSTAAICADGANVGLNPSSLAAPGQTAVYTWYAKKEGGYLFYSMAAPAGGEGDGGQLGLGLFGSINVEPRGAIAHRSQVTRDDLKAATMSLNPTGTPIVNYQAVFPISSKRAGDPVLSMLKPIPSTTNTCTKQKPCELIYSDLNAVIYLPREKSWSDDDWMKHYGCTANAITTSCGESFREFTSIFHDEITAVQAFRELEDESNTLNRVKDGMAINYGASSMGSAVLASRKGIGPAAHCAECKLEEFFLSSWANGDPAMLVQRDPANPLKAINALYPDDPSNVHHSYIGDAVRFRNMHAGPKETHVFHLHAHQWVRNDKDDNSMYLDSQTISPGASFSYQIYYGGSGNRNLTPGDSIFHCHLYPHFAQGMWELWRSHDVFEVGTELDQAGRPKFGARALPDGEIVQGTPIPAIVPVPGFGMPPLPTPEFKGYPFYIAGQPGHRPPQAPLDLVTENGENLNGGLPRHRILDASATDGKDAVDEVYNKDLTNVADLYYKGRKTVNENAKRVRTTSSQPELFGFARKLDSARIELLPLDGTPSEKAAMAFHEASGRPLVTTINGWQARSYDSFDSGGTPKAFLVNGKAAKPGAPYADPCPIGKAVRQYKAAYIQFDMTVNKAGWHDPQARIAVLQQDVKPTLDNIRSPEPLFIRANSDECIVFEATNLIPSALNVDDFQLFSPTDIIGQHIHLVKFDVTSSDGSENGWNYEDGTYSPDEVRERIDANNKYQASFGGTQILKPKAQPFFNSTVFSQAKCGARDAQGMLLPGQEDGPWCGAQTTAQRWWADPLLNSKGEDRTLRTVFTHDHFGPSSHQHHGLYAALVIEPSQSEWDTLAGTAFGGTKSGSQLIVRPDGGPTSYAANIVLPGANADQSRREFNLAFADFAIVYDQNNKPISNPLKMELDLPVGVTHPNASRPESISAGDPGSQLLNYRNEPIPLRISKSTAEGLVQKGVAERYPACRLSIEEELCPSGDTVCEERNQSKSCKPGETACILKLCDPGDMANVFSSKTHVGQVASLAYKFADEPAGTRELGDPATPLLTAYQGDKVEIRLVQGGQEENHVFTMNGAKWLSQPGSPNSGYMNGQHIGISEHFEFDIKTLAQRRQGDYKYAASATDNLWDGTWGLLRAYPTDDNSHPLLARLPNNPRIKANGQSDQCPPGVPQREFDVTAWRVSDLLNKTPDGKPNELFYNSRFGISDPNAIVFLKNSEYLHIKDKDVFPLHVIDHTDLRTGKQPIEPLVLRAAAGDCITVTLNNNLDNGEGGAKPIDQRMAFLMKDGPEDNANANRSWSFNMEPPITDGFNFNQVRMSNRVGLHTQLVGAFPELDDGANVGMNFDTTAAPGESKDYTWYAGDMRVAYNDRTKEWKSTPLPIEFGASSISDQADVIKHTSHGAIGALIIEPQGSYWSSDTGSDVSANICKGPWQEKCKRLASGNSANPAFQFREFVLLYQDDLALYQSTDVMANLRNGDDAEDSGQKGFNYRAEPLWARLGAGGPATGPDAMTQYDFSKAFSSKLNAKGKCEFDDISEKPCDPATPLFTAVAGTPIRMRVVHPGGHPRNHAFTLFGHNWQSLPWTKESTVMGYNPNSDVVGSTNGIGPGRHVNIVTKAGGEFSVPGDYMYRTQEGFMFGAGLWGIMRVCKPNDADCISKSGETK